MDNVVRPSLPNRVFASDDDFIRDVCERGKLILAYCAKLFADNVQRAAFTLLWENKMWMVCNTTLKGSRLFDSLDWSGGVMSHFTLEEMNKMRWCYGDTNPVVAAVQADTVIEMGDLLWLDGRVAKPACELWDLIVFKNNFLGVAMQQSPKGHTAPIRVATSGVFEFPCTAHSVELGNLVTVVTGDGLKLANQIVSPTGEKYFVILADLWTCSQTVRRSSV